MREIKREYTLTSYQILESNQGQVSELGNIILEGTENMQKARSKAQKQYPENNIFIGTVNTETAVYKMDIETFLKYAKKSN